MAKNEQEKPSIWTDIVVIVVIVNCSYQLGMLFPGYIFAWINGLFLSAVVVLTFRSNIFGNIVRSAASIIALILFVMLINQERPEELMLYLTLIGLMLGAYWFVRRFGIIS